MCGGFTEQYACRVKQVQDWLVNLPTRQLIELAAQHKIMTYANKTPDQLVNELCTNRQVQELALERLRGAT